MITEDLYTKDCIRTHSGLYVNIFDPKPEMFCIEDIAHALSMIPRFGGHLPEFFSVAQHSVYTMGVVSTDNKFTALMHDASEAYLMDIPTPIKRLLTNYKEIEHNLMEVLAKVFQFEYPLPDDVIQADKFSLEWEWDALMLGQILDKNYPFYWSHAQAKFAFLKQYHELH